MPKKPETRVGRLVKMMAMLAKNVKIRKGYFGLEHYGNKRDLRH
jgi:hypothetical protein